MTKITSIIIYGISFYLFVIIIMFIFQRSLLYQPSKERLDPFLYSNTGLEKINLKTSDGLVLNSLFRKPSTNKNDTIVVFHGNAGHIGHRVDKFRSFLEEGYGLFLVEYRGYGKNPGNPSEDGFHKDGDAALEFLTKQNISKQKTILYGESLGCGLTVKLSIKEKYKAIILEAPFTSIAEVASRHYWYLPAKWLVLDRFDILSIIKNIKSPLLILHGEKDNVISFDLGKKVFNAAPEPKESIFILNAGHNNLYEFNIFEKINNFLKDLNKKDY